MEDFSVRPRGERIGRLFGDLRCKYQRVRLAAAPVLWYSAPVKIDTETSQADLEKLNEAALRRECVKATPLNLRSFLRYAVLFFIFPGMVMGFRIGMAVTLLFAAVLVGILIWGSQELSAVAIYSWLAAGAFVTVLVSIGVFRKALRTVRQRRLCRKAVGGLKHPVTNPQHVTMHWQRDAKGEFYIARMVLHATATGLHAVLFSVPQYDGRKIITGGVTGTNIIQSGGKPGSAFHSLILYRLAKGNHELTWAVPAGEKAAPVAEVSLLNRLS